MRHALIAFQCLAARLQAATCYVLCTGQANNSLVNASLAEAPKGKCQSTSEDRACVVSTSRSERSHNLKLGISISVRESRQGMSKPRYTWVCTHCRGIVLFCCILGCMVGQSPKNCSGRRAPSKFKVQSIEIGSKLQSLGRTTSLFVKTQHSVSSTCNGATAPKLTLSAFQAPLEGPVLSS